MSSKKVILFCLFIKFSYEQTCKTVTPCSCKLDDGNLIDLTALDGGAKQPRFSGIDEPGAPVYKYDYNPCTPISNCANQAKSAVCQRPTNLGSSFDCGTQETASFIFKDGWTIQYTASDNNRQSIIHLICDESEEGKASFLKQDAGVAPVQWIYEINLISRHACLRSSASGISGGDILIIIVLVSLFVYLIGGIIINKFIRNHSGAAILPNKDFWTSLPGLIKEGFAFSIANTIKRTTYTPIK